MSTPPLSPVEHYFIEGMRRAGRRSLTVVLLRGAILLGAVMTLFVALATAAVRDARPDSTAAAFIGIPAGVLLALAGRQIIRRIMRTHDAHSASPTSNTSDPS